MFSRWTVPAWFWLAWAMLEEIHQTKFVSELIGDIRQFVPEHPVVATSIFSQRERSNREARPANR
jgi:hypothetical protein